MCKLKYFHLQASYGFCINTRVKKKLNFVGFQFELFQAYPCRFALLQDKSKKGLALDINKTHMCGPQNALCFITKAYLQ